MEPLISIIMPAYNVASYIDEAVQSILKQTYTNWELLIANDASTDNTKKIIDSYNDPRIKAFHNETNMKLLQTRNKLIRKAKGDYIVLMDADDLSHPNRLEKQLARFSKNEKLGLCGTWVQTMNSNGSKIRVHEKPVTYQEILNELPKSNPIGEATFMIKRQVLENVGLFRDYFDCLPCQGYDLLYLIAERYECENIPEPLYFYRMNPTSNSKIIDPKRVVTHNIVQHLGNQRGSLGKDDIMLGHYQHLEQMFDDLTQPFKNDKSLIYRHYAAYYMYSMLYRHAILSSINAIKTEPYKIINYRTLGYCVRKAIINKFK